MANFKVKNGLQAGRYLLNSTTLSGSTIDLSLASMFSTTLSSDPAYAFTNPPPSGTAQAFSVEVTGGTTNFVNDSFATTTYSGTGAYPSGGTSQTITNGLDLSGDGGLVWIKARNTDTRHALFDTERGITKMQNSADSAADTTVGTRTFTSFNSDGFTLGDEGEGWGRTNTTGNTYVSWTFKKQSSFFDIVTYTGTSAVQNISHSLGSVPGMIIVKCTNTAKNWGVYHRSVGSTKYLQLNTTGEANINSGFWNNTDPTSTQFTLGTQSNVNGNGNTYVAYLFAHDTASDSRIKCGSYTGNGATTGVFQDLGWQPQWIMIKNTDLSTEQWHIFDNVRGVVTDGADQRLEASRDVAEAAADAVDFTATGFYPKTVDDKTNGSGHSYIYMAIRGAAATDSAITWPSSVKWPSGLAPTTPAPGKKDLFTFLTTDGGTTYYGKKAAEGIA